MRSQGEESRCTGPGTGINSEETNRKGPKGEPRTSKDGLDMMMPASQAPWLVTRT